MRKFIIKNASDEVVASITEHDDFVSNWTNGENWLSKQEERKKPWGLKKDRWLFESEFDGELIIDSIDQRSIEVSTDPLVTETQYRFGAEYSVEILDLTDQLAQEAAERSARQADIDDIKLNIDGLDALGLSPLVIQILKRLVREL